MQIAKLRIRILAATLSTIVALGAGTAVYAYPVYRSVTANAGGVVVWNAANFGVSGQPVPTLSFFHFVDDNAARAGLPDAQCLVKVDLGNLVNPLVGTQVPVGNPGIPVNGAPGDNPRPFPWNITFDDNPPGHWSIAKTEIQNPPSSNNAASRVAAAGFQSLATTGGSGVTVVNGLLPNCAAQ
ncbi:hypothetical protein [Rhizobium sp. NPDC090279]|uniref:hypothetical protein n=1 Tax=Rhizobium sp. NPDC090279 TaxID=3364499 RepID=UPI00383BB7C7